MTTRGERRLEIARKLLKLPEDADVLVAIKLLASDYRDHIRGLVDWVEDYEDVDEQKYIAEIKSRKD